MKRLNYILTTTLITSGLTLASPNLALAQTVAEVTPAQNSAVAVKAQSLIKAESFKQAIDVLKQAQSNGEDTFEISELLVESYNGRINQVGMLKKRSLAKKMKKSMEHSVMLRPDSEKALKNLIDFHLNAPSIVGADKDKAREIIDGIPNLSPVRKYVYEANFSQADKDNVAAMENLEKALAIDPQHTGALRFKGNLQISEENYGAALATFQTCTTYHPANMDCRYQIGKASQMGNIQSETGIAAFKAFIAKGNDDKNYLAYAHYRLAKIYEQTDDAAKAKTHYELAISIDDLKKAKSALKKLN